MPQWTETKVTREVHGVACSNQCLGPTLIGEDEKSKELVGFKCKCGGTYQYKSVFVVFTEEQMEG